MQLTETPLREQGNMRLKYKQQCELQAITIKRLSERVKNGVENKELGY